MAKNPFSELDPSLHDTVHEAAPPRERKASALLGVTPVAAPLEALQHLSIGDLSGNLHSAVTTEVDALIKKRAHAIFEFCSGLNDLRNNEDSTDEDETEASERLQNVKNRDAVEALADNQFTANGIAIDRVLLQDVIDATFDYWNWGVLDSCFVPLTTFWSEYLTAREGKRPLLKITFEVSHWQKSFGVGLRDVNIAIEGNVKGKIGEKAEGCTIILDNFSGSIGKDARNCRFLAGDVDGSVLEGATDCAIEYGNHTSGILGNGAKSCLVSADTITVHSLLADAVDTTVHAKEIGKVFGAIKLGGNCSVEAQTIATSVEAVDDTACRVSAEKLIGDIDAGENWILEVGEILEPPTPQRVSRASYGKGGTRYYSENMEETPSIYQSSIKRTRNDSLVEYDTNEDLRKSRIAGALGALITRETFESQSEPISTEENIESLHTEISANPASKRDGLNSGSSQIIHNSSIEYSSINDNDKHKKDSW